MSTQEQLRTELLNAVERQLQGVELDDSMNVAVMAQQMSQLATKAAHPLDDELGPFYDVATVAGFTGWSRQNIASRIARGSLLGMSTASNSLVLPTFGFNGRSVATWVAPIVGAFKRAGVDGWTIGLWLTAPHLDLDDETPLGWLASGGDLGEVQMLVDHEIHRWAA